nr:hypothetical protein [Angustibacter aerolatus]
MATVDEPPRPGTTVEHLATLKTPFRPHGKVTAGNSAGLNDGATACLLTSADAAEEPRSDGEDATRGLLVRRRRARGHGLRPGAGHREGAAADRAAHRRHRAVRA